MVVLVVIVAYGAVTQNRFTPYLVVLATLVCALFVLTSRTKDYTVLLYGLGLAVVWQTSMLGHYIVGVDIHTEYNLTNRVIRDGWDFTYANGNNTSIILA